MHRPLRDPSLSTGWKAGGHNRTQSQPTTNRPAYHHPILLAFSTNPTRTSHRQQLTRSSPAPHPHHHHCRRGGDGSTQALSSTAHVAAACMQHVSHRMCLLPWLYDYCPNSPKCQAKGIKRSTMGLCVQYWCVRCAESGPENNQWTQKLHYMDHHSQLCKSRQ